MTGTKLAAAMAGSLLLLLPARGEEMLRIAMTASDIPTATGAPNNGYEGYRFLGYPIFEGVVLWDLSRAARPADLRPGLAESYEQVANDKNFKELGAEWVELAIEHSKLNAKLKTKEQ